MNLIPIMTDAQTMSSQEIADLTGKEHKNILRDVRVMLIGLYGEEHIDRIVPEHYRNRRSEFIRENTDAIFNAICEGFGDGSDRSHPKFRGFRWERDNRGYVTHFNLDHNHSMTLVAGYQVKLRKAIIDRWQELEAAQRPDPMMALSDPATMRALLLGYTEKVIALEGRVSELQPKVAAFDLIANLDGSLCITDAAKTLHVKPKVLFHFLRTKKWIYRRGGQGAEIAYSDKLQFGYLEHKITTVNRSDGTERSATQVRVTPAGLSKIAIWFHEQPELGVAP